MLRVARIADRTGRYYLADIASELDAGSFGPCPERSPHHDRWLGVAAERLALAGRVDADSLAAVLSGRHPSGRHRLRQRETIVSAFDLCFAAPKSASVLFGLGQPGTSADVRAAHDEAVDSAMEYVATHAAAVRRTSTDGRSPGPVDGLVAAAFTHAVTRALDPHLHTHVVVANLARGDDGRWRALDGRGLYAHAPAAGAVYDAVLRHGVTARLGLRWTPSAPGRWQLGLVDPVVAGLLSTRRADISAHLRLHAHGPSPTRRAKEVAWAATREPKAPMPSAAELRSRWESVARDSGWHVDLARGSPTRSAGGHELDEHRFAAGVAGVAGSAHRGVARRDTLAAWAGAIREGSPDHDLTRCVDMLADWESGIGVAERHVAPAAVVPPNHVQRALGPRPHSPGALAVWQSAAASVARYRERWDVRDPSPLGAETGAELSAMPARRLAEHLETIRSIDDALTKLGRPRWRNREREPELARGIGRDR